MGKIADIIKKIVRCFPGEITYHSDRLKAEKEIIKLIEKELIPKQEDGNVALYRIGYNDCRKDIKQNLRLRN